MPYTSKKTGKNEITVMKEDGKVVGHTTPENYNGYMAALHMHEPKKMAMGGLADDENNKLNDYLKMNMDDVQRTNDMGSVTSPQLPFQKTVQTPSIEEFKNEADDNEKVQDSNPGHSTEVMKDSVPAKDTYNDYIKGQEAQVDKYGPEQEKAVLDNILKSHRSIGNLIGRGATTFADALMQGVAQQGNPGFTKNLDENQARLDEMNLKGPQIEQEMNAKNMAAKQGLAAMTSSSPLGASMTAPMAIIFEKYGVPKDQIPKIMANPAAARSVLDNLTTMMTSDDKIKMEVMMKQLEMAQRGTQISQETANQQEGRKQEALKQLSSMPWYSRLIHPGVSSELEKSAGLNKEEPSHGIPELGSTFNGQKVTSVKRIK